MVLNKKKLTQKIKNFAGKKLESVNKVRQHNTGLQSEESY